MSHPAHNLYNNFSLSKAENGNPREMLDSMEPGSSDVSSVFFMDIKSDFNCYEKFSDTIYKKKIESLNFIKNLLF